MWLRVDPSSGLPIYRQIVEQVRRLVTGGVLKPGDQLPPVRDLAIDLAVNFNTVSKAYAELQHIGLVSSQQGRGSFIAAQAPSEQTEDQRQVALVPDVDRMLLVARTLGLDDTAVRSVVEERLRVILPTRGDQAKEE